MYCTVQRKITISENQVGPLTNGGEVSANCGC